MSSNVDKLGRDKKDPRDLWKELQEKHKGQMVPMVDEFEDRQRLAARLEALAQKEGNVR